VLDTRTNQTVKWIWKNLNVYYGKSLAQNNNIDILKTCHGIYWSIRLWQSNVTGVLLKSPE